MNRKKLSLFAVLVFVMMAIPAQGIKVQAASCKLDNAAWVGTFGYGVSCLDDSGWTSYVKGSSDLQSNQIADVAVCADGSTWVANTLGLLKVTADKTQAIDTADISSMEAVACDRKGGVWVAHYKGVSHFADGKWDTTDSSKLGTGDNVSLVKDVAVSPEGKVYVVTSNSVALYDGKAWTVYEKGKGFADNYFLEKIALDAKGNPFVAEDNGILTFDGKAWTEIKSDKLSLAQSVAVDSKGVVWVGTYSNGVSSFDGKSWTTYDRTNSKLSSNHVRVLAVDGQDRLWAGTEYGLDIFDGKDFTVYRMDNSDVLDNEIDALAVNGKGPAVPKVTSKKPGSLSGTIVNGKNPIANSTIEVCVEFIGSSFSGDSPCGDNPFTKQAKTDKDGKFTLTELPVGRYGLVVLGADGKWQRMTDSSSINSKIEVTEGRDTDIGTIDLGKTTS